MGIGEKASRHLSVRFSVNSFQISVMKEGIEALYLMPKNLY